MPESDTPSGARPNRRPLIIRPPARLFTGFLYGHVQHGLQERVHDPEETEDLLRLGLHRLPITQFPDSVRSPRFSPDTTGPPNSTRDWPSCSPACEASYCADHCPTALDHDAAHALPCRHRRPTAPGTLDRPAGSRPPAGAQPVIAGTAAIDAEGPGDEIEGCAMLVS